MRPRPWPYNGGDSIYDINNIDYIGLLYIRVLHLSILNGPHGCSIHIVQVPLSEV
jgi:hypothetical protein